MGVNPLSTKLAKEYCDKFPSVATRTLARMLYRDNKAVYTNEETARSAIRTIRKENGGGKRAKVKTTSETTKRERLSIPESTAEDILPVVMNEAGRGLVMSDLHIPFHDAKDIEASIKFAEKEKFTDFLILNGDIADCYQLSKFVKDPRQRDFAGEIKDIQTFLRYCVERFKKVIYKLGNHEKRYGDYLRIKAPELLGIEDMELKNILKLEDIGVAFVNHTQVIHAGQLTILHGHETGRGVFSPVNAARGMYLRAHSCTLSGHLHRTSQHNEADIRRSLTVCWTTGCLCHLQPEYAPINSWDHGFALMDFDGDDWFEVQTRRIVKGRVV